MFVTTGSSSITASKLASVEVVFIGLCGPREGGIVASVPIPSIYTFLMRYVVDIVLTDAQMQTLYAGAARDVVARDVRGVTLRFPLQRLRPFVSHVGVRGRFALDVDQGNRLQRISRLGDLNA